MNDDITPENFPLDQSDGAGKEEVEVVLVHMDQYLTTEQIKAELDRRGLKPASIVEFLALGAVHSDLQCKFSVVALGSSWRSPDGGLRVPVLWDGGGKRRLSLDYDCPGSEWRGNYRFAALRK